MIFVVPMIVYALLLLGIVSFSGLRKEDLQYLLTFPTVGGVLFAVGLLVIDLAVCIAVLVANRRRFRSDSQWRSALLRVGEVFLVPVLLWLMSWVVLGPAVKI